MILHVKLGILVNQCFSISTFNSDKINTRVWYSLVVHGVGQIIDVTRKRFHSENVFQTEFKMIPDLCRQYLGTALGLGVSAPAKRCRRRPEWIR